MANGRVLPDAMDSVMRRQMKNDDILEHDQRTVALLWLPVTIALLIRFVVVLLNFRDTPDAALHFERFGWEMGWIARSLAEGHGYSSPFFPQSGPTALMPPLYPWLLSLIFRLTGVYSVASAFVVLSLNSLCSSLICVTIYWMAQPILGWRTARIAAWAWALHPFAIYFSANRVWDYALTGLLLSLCFCIAQRLPVSRRRSSWFGFGLLYGLTALANPSVLVTFPFLLVLALRHPGGSSVRPVPAAMLASLGVFLMLLPWTLRNERTMHTLCPVRDNFWLEFWAGNTGDTSNPMPGWTHPASNPAEMSRFLALGELPYLAEKRVFAIDFLQHHPVFFAGLTFRRAAFFWTGFWSLSPAYRAAEPTQLPNVFFCTSLTLLMLAGMGRLLRQNRAAALPFLVFIAIFPITYYLTHPLMDYRQPIEPEILILIVAGVLSLRRHRAAASSTAQGIGDERLSVASS